MKFQILHIFLWMMACHNYSLSDWTLGHPEEPIHSEFYPSQKESFGRWSKTRKIRNDFICSGALSNTPQNNPLHVIARYTTLKECWILVLVNILLNLSLKLHSRETEPLAPPSFLFDSEWVQGENLLLRVPSSYHHPNILSPVLRRPTYQPDELFTFQLMVQLEANWRNLCIRFPGQCNCKDNS